jgi:alpha-aminoadipic semialdehyde synthase
MKNILGIRHEDKYVMERRVAITPAHIKKLLKKNIPVHVEKSQKRVFRNNEFEAVGATITDNLDMADVIFGVKEMPIGYFKKDKTYVFFSHVIKGQSYNMPLLQDIIDSSANLIDYEKVVNESGKRLIFFGKYAGMAGMINSLWAYGQRLKEQGFYNPFTKIRQAHTYPSLHQAKKEISELGLDIINNGLPKEISPLVIGFTGYGNVSVGAQEIASLLPVKEVSPDELLDIKQYKNLPRNVIYKVVFKEENLSERIDGESFDLNDYYENPQLYRSKFEQYIPSMSILINGMYWDERYPRIVTKDYLKDLYQQGEPKLKVIGDISCDVNGSIECTHKGAEIENPVFVYDPEKKESIDGFKGNGILLMTVDILPSELPREASVFFSRVLERFTEDIMECDFKNDFENLELPSPIKKALIVHKGELTPDYTYLNEYLEKNQLNKLETA